MCYLKKLTFAACFLITSIQGHSQEPGMPIIRNFPAREYRASQQNWAIVQDFRGILYVANYDGLLEYDGVTWRLNKLTGVRSLAVDAAGRVYVGLENDIGYIEPEGKGMNVFKSLKSALPESDRGISTVFNVHAVGDRIVYMSNDKIFIYRNGTIKVIKPLTSFHLAFVVNGKYYVD